MEGGLLVNILIAIEEEKIDDRRYSSEDDQYESGSVIRIKIVLIR